MAAAGDEELDADEDDEADARFPSYRTVRGHRGYAMRRQVVGHPRLVIRPNGRCQPRIESLGAPLHFWLPGHDYDQGRALIDAVLDGRPDLVEAMAAEHGCDLGLGEWLAERRAVEEPTSVRPVRSRPLPRGFALAVELCEFPDRLELRAAVRRDGRTYATETLAMEPR